jgi:hypothetical protein
MEGKGNLAESASQLLKIKKLDSAQASSVLNVRVN